MFPFEISFKARLARGIDCTLRKDGQSTNTMLLVCLPLTHTLAVVEAVGQG